MKKKEKRNFLLFEVLIALQLVSFGALFVLETPLRYFRQEIKTLQKMEYERMADLTFSEIKQAFYFSQISWENIPLKKKDALFSLWKDPLPSSSELLGKAHRYYRIYGSEKRGGDQSLYRFLTVELFLTPLASPPKDHEKKKKTTPYFTYHLFVQKKPLIF